MTGLLYLAAIFGVLWLGLWTMLKETDKQPFWMPFGYKMPAGSEKESAAAPPPESRRRAVQGWRERAEARRQR